MSYKHLTLKERYQINAYRHTKTQKEIAKIVGVHPSTISRELKRGRGRIGKDYWVMDSHNKSVMRQIEKSKTSNLKLTKDTIELIKKYLKIQYSPEQISHRYDTVSHQTIYNWIYRIEDENKRKNIIAHLRRGGKKYRTSKKTKGYESITAPKTMINERPDEINNRERCGDFEGDTVHLSGRERLYTLVDRKSRYTIIKYLKNGYAELIHQATIDIVHEMKETIHSITFDNGKEFSFHDLISLDTGIKIYFAFPYHSWERGTNENTNGLIRQYFPKGVVHYTITEEDIRRVEEKLNHRPRKCLNWLTPYEVFIEKKKPEDFQVQALI